MTLPNTGILSGDLVFSNYNTDSFRDPVGPPRRTGYSTARAVDVYELTGFWTPNT